MKRFLLNDSARFSRPFSIGLFRVLANAYEYVKRPCEFVLALALFMLCFPVIFLFALLVKATSKGPMLYTQVRLGWGGRPYTIYKLRTMRHNCERESGARWSVSGDPRITPLGRFLRKTHIDEFPQLWNVLRGDMSLVGPRPERPEFVPALQRAIPSYKDRVQVRPGITGLAQVRLPADTDLASVRRKLAYDLYYISHAGVLLDLKIITATGLSLLGIPSRFSIRLLRIPAVTAIEGNHDDEAATVIPVFEPAGASLTAARAPAAAMDASRY